MAYGLKTKGGNKTKNPHMNDEWMKAKKLGRPRQIWVYDELEGRASATASGSPGHWEMMK